MDKAEVIKKVADYKLLVQDHFEIGSIYLFGSYARETEREDSDIDVAIIVDKELSDFLPLTHCYGD